MAARTKKVAQSAETKSEQASAVALTKAQETKMKGLETWSAKIRYLDSQGFSRSEIANALGKRYQHVRNVLITPVSKPKS